MNSRAIEIFFNEEYWKNNPFKVSIICVQLLIFTVHQLTELMLKDIENRADIDLVIKTFYDKLLADDKINYFFSEVTNVKFDLQPHLDIISAFWEGILFRTGNYHRNAMAPHLKLHKESPLTREHFKIWLNHLHSSLDELYVGKNVEIVKMRSKAIAELMQMKTEMMDQ